MDESELTTNQSGSRSGRKAKAEKTVTGIPIVALESINGPKFDIDGWQYTYVIDIKFEIILLVLF